MLFTTIRPLLVLACTAITLLSGCATGPKFGEVVSSIPPLSATEGRIYFYRLGTAFGAAIQPNIRVNDEVVGESKPGGFFFVDQAPGEKEVTTRTEVERKITFPLEAGQTRYVRTNISMGFLVGHVAPELVHDDTAKSELPELAYIGSPLTATIASSKGGAPSPAAPVAEKQGKTATIAAPHAKPETNLGEARYDYQNSFGRRGVIAVSTRSSDEEVITQDLFFSNQPAGHIRWAKNLPPIAQASGGGIDWVLLSPFFIKDHRSVNTRTAIVFGESYDLSLTHYGKQTTTTPAGTFATQRVKIEGNRNSGTTSVMFMQYFAAEAWYEQETGRLIRLKYHSTNADRSRPMDEYELRLIKPL